MAIGIIIPDRDPQPIVSELKRYLGEEIQVYPHITKVETITSILAWKQPKGIFSQFPNLELVSSLGAGVDHILEDPSLPSTVAVTRIVYENLGRSMARYAAGAVLQFHKSLLAYYQCKEKKNWDRNIPFEVEMRIGIMGMGKMGQEVGKLLLAMNFEVYGYSMRPKFIPGIRCFSAENQELSNFLRRINTLICLLPLTEQTRGILNASLFAQLPPNSFLINLGRGQHLVDSDLIAAIDQGIISGAYLDVFNVEPLPPDHPFWILPQVYITPHIASITDSVKAAKQFALNHQRLALRKPLINRIDREVGY
ncbi:MAG: glyoxylate/hydroxypyruvate reductase A [Bacteroidota bacterium]